MVAPARAGHAEIVKDVREQAALVEDPIRRLGPNHPMTVLTTPSPWKRNINTIVMAIELVTEGK